jgi:hypothetical protein
MALGNESIAQSHRQRTFIQVRCTFACHVLQCVAEEAVLDAL